MTYPVKITEPDRSPPVFFWTLALIFALAFAYVPYMAGARTGDWWEVFYPAGNQPMLAYTNDIHFVYPPWMALLLAPISRWGPEIAYPLFVGISAGIVSWGVWQWSGRWWILLLVLTSAPMIAVLTTGQVDAIPLLGLIVYTLTTSQGEYSGQMVEIKNEDRPQANPILEFLAIVLLAAKPQIAGLSAGIIWLRSHKRWWLLAAFVGLIGITLVIWPGWMGIAYARLGGLDRKFSVDLWPWGIAVGIVLAWIAVGHRDVLIAAVATYFFLPYINLNSLIVVAVILAVRLPKLYLVFYAATWAIFIAIRAGMG